MVDNKKLLFLLLSLVLFILSMVSYGSITTAKNNLPAANQTSLNNAQNASLLLGVLSGVMLGVVGYSLYMEHSSQPASLGYRFGYKGM